MVAILQVQAKEARVDVGTHSPFRDVQLLVYEDAYLFGKSKSHCGLFLTRK
jgi:hypothetical protein